MNIVSDYSKPVAEPIGISNRLNQRAGDKKNLVSLVRKLEHMKTKIIIERAMPYWRKLLLIKCDRNVEIETIIKQFKDVG